jgi:hypothetical protein
MHTLNESVDEASGHNGDQRDEQALEVSRSKNVDKHKRKGVGCSDQAPSPQRQPKQNPEGPV